MRRPRSLRARLVLVTIVLTLLGLGIAGIATYGALKDFLVNRIDGQLRDAQSQIRGPAVQDLLDGRVLAFEPPGTPRDLQRGEVAVYSVDGRRRGAAPGWPSRIEATPGARSIRIGGQRYRMFVGPINDRRVVPGQYVVAVALPLDDVSATLNRLLAIEIIVGITALAAAGLVGFALVRLGLQPLTDIERTAEAIAQGNLWHRVADENPATEVGRLGRSLNVMLGQIEESFSEREASEARLRQFVADASHELQTPLTSVRGYAELFRRGAADRPEDLATAMRRIEAEAERMGVLVDDLLLLARLDQGRPLERAPVDLTAVVTDQVGDLRVVAPDHPITVTAPRPVTVMGDEVRLRQVVSNLLGNARTHTPEGTTISITVQQDGAFAVVEVADDGPGIPQDYQERIFERFFRGDPSRARTSGGTGLGLAIVSAIVTSHGGSVVLDEPVGGGTVFTIRLPIDGGAADAMDGALLGPSAENTGPSADGPSHHRK